MDKSPKTFKRRCGRPPSELPWDAIYVNVNPESAVSVLARLLASEDDGIGVVTPDQENVHSEKRSRKRWSDQSLPRKRTRSCSVFGTDFNVKDRASKSIGMIFGNKAQDKGKVIRRSRTPRNQAKDRERAIARKQAKDIEGTAPCKQAKDFEKATPRKHASEESAGGGKPVSSHSPIEFVKEKQDMFAEIDAFELESEEDDTEESMEGEVEIELPESSKGETARQSPIAKPKQSTRDVPITKPEQSTQDVKRAKEAEEKENG